MPGSVTLFWLINDSTHHVMVMIDNDLLAQELVGFHPNINTATLVLSSSDFKKFLAACGLQIRYCTL
jgi:Ala-tRNA(Pro) deacylase